MASKFAPQYNILGLKPPSKKMDDREKAEIIFHAACKKLGIDPAALPVVHHLKEKYRGKRIGIAPSANGAAGS